MSYLEELLPEFRKGAKIRRKSWNEKEFIRWSECCQRITRHPNEKIYGIFYDFSSEDIIADDWEMLTHEPIYWDYIIKNKCLCWFWETEKDKKILRSLKAIAIDGDFIDNTDYRWLHCKPVRKDEVTFYEDRKDVV